MNSTKGLENDLSRILNKLFLSRGHFIRLISLKSGNDQNSDIKENLGYMSKKRQNDPEPARYSYAKRNHSPKRSYTFPTSPAPCGNRT